MDYYTELTENHDAFISAIPDEARCELCGQHLCEERDERTEYTDIEVLKGIAELNHKDPTNCDIILERVGFMTPYEILAHRHRLTLGAVRARGRKLAKIYPSLRHFLARVSTTTKEENNEQN